MNGEIGGEEVGLRGVEGEEVGIVSVREGVEKGEEGGVELVEMRGKGEGGVCGIMD